MGRRESGIAEIAQAASLLSARIMREEGLGVAESDLLLLVREQPGISQKEVCRQLGMDKGAVARRTVNLEQKGYLIRKVNPVDARSQILYPTEKADSLKGTGTDAEEAFFDWLIEQLSEEERAHFCETLELLRERAGKESRDGYPNVCERLHRAPFETGQRVLKEKRYSDVRNCQEESKRRPGVGGNTKEDDKKQGRRKEEDTRAARQQEPDIWLL